MGGYDCPHRLVITFLLFVHGRDAPPDKLFTLTFNVTDYSLLLNGY